MKKIISNCFGTTKKAIVSTVCIAAAVAVVGGAAYAATATTGTGGNTSVIGESLAQNYAFADAGVDPAAATNVITEYDYEDGQFIYDVEFTADDTEYEYWIRAADGAVIRKSADIINPISADAGLTEEAAATETAADTESTGEAVSTEGTNSQGDSGTVNTAGSTGSTTGTGSTSGAVSTGSSTAANSAGTASAATSGISLDRAKEIALADAGVSASDVTYKKAKKDTDDGVAVYDIEFYTASAEYEYEIRVSDGVITDRSQEAHQTSGTQTSSGTSTASESSASYISVDDAKAIALNRAGLSASDVVFQKAMLERDDGIMVYDIEFYNGYTEYECTVNATTGAILEYDMDVDD